MNNIILNFLHFSAKPQQGTKKLLLTQKLEVLFIYLFSQILKDDISIIDSNSAMLLVY